MTALEQAVMSGQVSPGEIEAHRAAGELPIVINAGGARVVFSKDIPTTMFEPTPETVLYAEKTRSHNLIKNGKPQTLREVIDGATDESAHVWCKAADVRAALLDAERYRFARLKMSPDDISAAWMKHHDDLIDKAIDDARKAQWKGAQS